MSDVLLKIDGAVEQPLALTFDDLAAFPEAAQFADVSRIHPSRRGDGVTLDAILERARVRPAANYLTLHADRDDFHGLRAARGDQGPGDRRLQAGLGCAGRRAWRADPVDHPRPGRLPHRRSGRLRQRQVLEPHRADRAPRPRHASGNRVGPRGSS